MSSRFKVLYHVTSAERYIRIVATGGIRREYSEGRIKRCYYCEKQQVPWAISHCMWKHDWTVQQVVVLRIKAKAEDFLKCGMWPFYATQIAYLPYDVESAVNFIKRTEKAVMKLEWLENGEFWDHLKDEEVVPQRASRRWGRHAAK